MKRLIDHYLRKWKDDTYRMPLLLRGARQIGKTYAVRELGKSFDHFIEINLERMTKVHEVFEKDFIAEEMLHDLTLRLKKPIKPGKTLLFFDEIQAAPKALIALRYFYEEMPELHVIAAGSLLDFAIEQVGIPVGRVQSLYMFPLTFIEFLSAIGEDLLVEEILTHELNREMTNFVHMRILDFLAKYLALGGMPKVADCYRNSKDPLKCALFHSSILDSYRQDFGKYAKKHQIKYLEPLFKAIPFQLGGKFKYSAVEGEFRKRELSPALDLLETAGIAHKVFYSSSQGFPLGAQIDPFDYKVLFLDVGLAQAVLKLDITDWFLYPEAELINKGKITEAFVGQEMLAYGNPYMKHDLYYWHRKAPASQAEVDYVIQEGKHIIPVEIKSGHGKTLKSLHSFMENHAQTPYGIRFSTHNYSVYDKIHSYPLYAVAKVAASNSEVKLAIEALITK